MVAALSMCGEIMSALLRSAALFLPLAIAACGAIKALPANTEPVTAEAIWQFRYQGSDARTAARDACMASKWQDIRAESRRVGCSYLAACSVVNSSMSWDENARKNCASITAAKSAVWAKYTDIGDTLTTVYR